MNNNNTYKDPKRKIGSQSEIPSINFEKDYIIVYGYQRFSINKKTKKIMFNKKQKKFNYINELLKKLNKTDNCTSIVDIGCNSGLTSLIAYNNNYNNIVSLDHDPEYINILSTIKEHLNIKEINETVFTFGNNINQKFDIVFCGAIIHWIFSLTADFRNFDSIISYLIQFTNKYILIEWIKPNDGAIKTLNHIKKRGKSSDEEYNTKNFELAVNKYTTIISKKIIDSSTRILYVLSI